MMPNQMLKQELIMKELRDTVYSGDDPPATTGVAATPEPVSMDTEGTQDHSSSPPSHPDTPLHPS